MSKSRTIEEARKAKQFAREMEYSEEAYIERDLDAHEAEHEFDRYANKGRETRWE